jgi:hypothetical protein
MKTIALFRFAILLIAARAETWPGIEKLAV